MNGDGHVGFAVGRGDRTSLTRAARRAGRAKSDLARDALREYLGRVDDDAEMIEQLRAVAAATTEEDIQLMDELQADLEALLDQEEASLRTSRAA